MGEWVAILDAGAQYGKVIDRRVREQNVESRLMPMDTPVNALQDCKAIIISGGPESVYDPTAPKVDPELFDIGIPILGICYGMQLMNQQAGGTVTQQGLREDGQETINVATGSPLFYGLQPQQRVLLTHGDSLERTAEGFYVTARSGNLVSAIENTERALYGVQFHPEVDLTTNGTLMLRNFLFNISGCEGKYTIEDRVEKAVKSIQEQVGNGDVLVLVSGGVDSTVCATLLAKALGPDKVHAVHIDNGFMRYRESEVVAQTLRAHGIDVQVIDASNEFYTGRTNVKGKTTEELRHTTSPEEKRNIIGDTFMRIARQYLVANNFNPETTFLGQGTLRPDLIESASSLASGKAHTIKTHHNDTALVRAWREEGKVVEPLQEYHKDEVRTLGNILGLPEELVWRQPFPGPGLAVRILCTDGPYQQSDFATVQEAVREFSAPAIKASLLPVRTVGVQGDGRSYSYLAALSGDMAWDELFTIAHQMPKVVHAVNRVAYVFGEKIDESMIEVTPTHLTEAVIHQLQLADAVVNDVLREYDLIRPLSQVPVVSFPVSFGESGFRSIAIRTFITNDFMTGVPARPGVDLPFEALDDMVARILLEVPGVSRVAYDLTSKPPGTTEWE